MKNNIRRLIFFSAALLTVLLVLSSCQPAQNSEHEQQVLSGSGVLVAIDAHTLTIEFGGATHRFTINEESSLPGLEAGDEVHFTYREEEEGFFILTLDKVEKEETGLGAEGFYMGQIDSHSVEIEMEGMPVAFSVKPDFDAGGLEIGSKIKFTYKEEEPRPLILSIDHAEPPAESEDGYLIGVGLYVGQIDPQSVEIQIRQAFELAIDISFAEVEEGALIAFSYSEDQQKAIIESFLVTAEPIEGNYAFGTLIKHLDQNLVEVEYFRAFDVGDADLGEVQEGDRVTFTYKKGELRDHLASIAVTKN